MDSYEIWFWDGDGYGKVAVFKGRSREEVLRHFLETNPECNIVSIERMVCYN